MIIVDYTSDRALEIADLFHSSVHAIDHSIYSSEQKEAWAPTPPNYEKWKARLSAKKPYLAIVDERVAGFIELDSDGHIDCTYTSPDYQRQGVAKALFNHILCIAKSRGNKRLYVEASFIAKPLFEKFGFSVIHENKVEREQIVLTNFTMDKWLQS